MQDANLRDLAIYVAACPDAQCLVDHLATATLRHLEPSTVALYVLDEPPREHELVLAAHNGLNAMEVDGYSRIDTTFCVPATKALGRSLPFSVSLADFGREFPLLRTRPDLDPLTDQVLVPIHIEGAPQAVLCFTIPEPLQWNPDAWQNALALQALLTLYLQASGPASRKASARANHSAPARSLTERQTTILTLVSEGKSTSSIAARLGFSESTIKQDIHRVMVALGADSRQQAVVRARELSLLPSA